MKPDKKVKACFTCSVLFVVGFVFSVVKDYATYNTTLNSAPLSTFILVNAVTFLLPALLFAFIGLIKMRNH